MNTCQIVSLFTVITLTSARAATTLYDFEGASVPSAFSLTGQAGAFSQSITSTNSYAGSNALSLNLTCTGPSQWAQTTIVLPDVVQHVSFAIYDEFAGSSPFYNYFFLVDSLDANIPADGLLYLDSGYEGIVHMVGETTTFSTTRTVGWHVMDAFIGNDTIEYHMDGNLMGTVAIDPSRHIDSIVFNISNAGNHRSDSLLIDNLSITTIPEPSSSLLGLIAFCGFTFRRSRSYSPNNTN